MPASLLELKRDGTIARAVVDSRQAGPGDLFVGLPGEHADGGTFARQALERGAVAALAAPGHGATHEALDPLTALQDLATAWRRELGADVIGITGSTGKTSTKDLLAAMLRPHRAVVATPANYNTEIGLPLTILGAPAGTRVLVLEMAMRGAGQIAELARIAEPGVAVITNIGPVHLELLGSIENIAATKAELIGGLPPGGTAVVPEDEPLLDAHLRDDIRIERFGDALPDTIELPFTSAHMRRNAAAALAAARAVGVEPAGTIEVQLSALRGERIELRDGIVVVNDCYNANPMSMRAALVDLAVQARGRKVAVLGDMLELGPGEQAFHEEVGALARQQGVDVLVTVGPLAAHMGGDHAAGTAAEAAALLPGLLQPGDTVLVKGSRGVGLEVVAERLADG